MSSIPVVDYDRSKRLYIPPDPLPFSQYNTATRICFLIMILAGVVLFMRWHGKRKETSSNVRLQKV